MSEPSFPRWLAAVGVFGGVAIALGLPYLTLVHGDGLSATMKMMVIVLALAAGGTLVRAGQSPADSDVVRRDSQRRVT